MLLKNATLSNTKPIIENNTACLAKVLQVYDGDTVKIALAPKGATKPFLWSLRLEGIDTPELRTRCEEEKKHAVLCKEYLKSLVEDKIVLVHIRGKEKYGRLLGTIYIDAKIVTVGGIQVYITKPLKNLPKNIPGGLLSVSTIMLENTSAVQYDGGGKTQFSVENIPHKKLSRAYLEPEFLQDVLSKQQIRRNRICCAFLACF